MKVTGVSSIEDAEKIYLYRTLTFGEYKREFYLDKCSFRIVK